MCNNRIQKHAFSPLRKYHRLVQKKKLHVKFTRHADFTNWSWYFSDHALTVFETAFIYTSMLCVSFYLRVLCSTETCGCIWSGVHRIYIYCAVVQEDGNGRQYIYARYRYAEGNAREELEPLEFRTLNFELSTAINTIVCLRNCCCKILLYVSRIPYMFGSLQRRRHSAIQLWPEVNAQVTWFFFRKSCFRLPAMQEVMNTCGILALEINYVLL